MSLLHELRMLLSPSYRRHFAVHHDKHGTLQRIPDPEVDARVDPRRNDQAAIAERWRIHNERARAAGCQCGKAATHVARQPNAIGSTIMVEIWTCADHVGVNHWSSNPDGTASPRYDRTSPCGDCVGRCSTSGRIGAARPDSWACPTRPDPADAAPPFGGWPTFFDSITPTTEETR